MNGLRDSGDVRHFRALEKLKMPIGSGGVICLAEQNLPLTPSTQSIPVTALWKEFRPFSPQCSDYLFGINPPLSSRSRPWATRASWRNGWDCSLSLQRLRGRREINNFLFVGRFRQTKRLEIYSWNFWPKARGLMGNRYLPRFSINISSSVVSASRTSPDLLGRVGGEN